MCPKLSSCACVLRARHHPSPLWPYGGEVMEWVFKFKYLGTLLSSSRDILVEVQARVVKVIGTFASFKPILLNKAISLGIWMLFYMVFIPPTLTFGCEFWALKLPMASHFEATRMSFLRSMLGSAYWTRFARLRFCNVATCCPLQILSTSSGCGG
jgi:hypothetical protein